jgi:hypothetical protein
LQADFKAGNLAAIGSDEQLVLQLTQTYQKLRGSGSPTASSSPSGSATPTASH